MSELAAAASGEAAAAPQEQSPPFRVQFGPGALGLRLRLLPDGTIGVIGFTEDAADEVRKALETGDRICAIGKNPVPPFTALEKAALYITSSERPVDIIFFRPHVADTKQVAPGTAGRVAPAVDSEDAPPAKKAKAAVPETEAAAASADASKTTAAAE